MKLCSHANVIISINNLLNKIKIIIINNKDNNIGGGF